MQILIEISKEAYEKIQTKSMLISASAIEEVIDAVKHGEVYNETFKQSMVEEVTKDVIKNLIGGYGR